MGTALALCGAMVGWGVSVLITHRRVAVVQVRCDAAEAENARWRQAHSGQTREPVEALAVLRDRAAADGGSAIGSSANGIRADSVRADGLRTDGMGTDGSPGFAERAFVNIGRRVQAIVHKQLADLSEMQERHGSDPAVFADLMRLDHATALVGRFADSLVVLAGERPGRQWSEPVPVFSVLRGAMARIVDYRRVELAAAPEVELAGTAVEAVVHALAELLDNATRYSPPDSRVILTGRRTSAGVVIEVVDAGVGLAPQAAEHVARVLADPGAAGMDLADIGGSPRLGLAVVGRLAHTVGFQASVRPSAGGGVKAQLLVPIELVLAPRGAADSPAVPRVPSQAGRAAQDAGEPGARPNGTPDGRPGGLPQRKRRPPTMPVPVPVTTTPVVTKTARARPESPGTDSGPAATDSGPGQWLDAFRGDPPESPGEDTDRERGAAS